MTPEFFLEKREAIRPPDPPPAQKIPTTRACIDSLCQPKPGRVTTECCGRVCFRSVTPGIPLVVEPPCDGLQPVKGDFDLEAEWWDRKNEPRAGRKAQ